MFLYKFKPNSYIGELMEGFENEVERILMERFGDKGKVVFEEMKKFLESAGKNVDDVAVMKISELNKMVKDFGGKIGLNDDEQATLLDAIGDAKTMAMRKAQLRAAIPAIMARSGNVPLSPNERNELMNKVRELERKMNDEITGAIPGKTQKNKV